MIKMEFCKSYFDVKPNKNLINENFNGYKLSTKEIRCILSKVNEGVDYLECKDDRYDYLHLRLFAYHNSLYGDLWSNNNRSVYYINKRWDIIKTNLSEDLTNVENVFTVWTIPNISDRTVDRYNTSLCFASDDIAVVCNGLHTLYVLNTGKRKSPDPEERWNVLSEIKLDQKNCYKLNDVQFFRDEMVIVLLNVERLEKPEVAGDAKSKTCTTITTLIYQKDESRSWFLNSTHIITSNDAIDYAHAQANFKGVAVVAKKPVKIYRNKLVNLNGAALSENDKLDNIASGEIESNIGGSIEVENSLQSPTESTVGKSIMYQWSQSVDNVKVRFFVPEHFIRPSVLIDINGTRINVQLNDEGFFFGFMRHSVDEKQISWTFHEDTNQLELTLVKLQSGLMWSCFVSDDEVGEQLFPPEATSHSKEHPHLSEGMQLKANSNCEVPSFNFQKHEECDNAETDELILYYICCESDKVISEIYFGKHPLLFNTRTSADSLPMMCTRHDVDGFAWQISVSTDEGCCKHVSALHAFGYVLASKQKKFVAANAEWTYIVVGEPKRRLYIYRHEAMNKFNDAIQASVNNGTQHVIDFGSDEAIMGVHPSDEVLFVLTDTTLRSYIISELFPSKN